MSYINWTIKLRIGVKISYEIKRVIIDGNNKNRNSPVLWKFSRFCIHRPTECTFIKK